MANGETLKSHGTDEWKELAERAESFEKAQEKLAPERMKRSYRDILEYQRSFRKRTEVLGDSGKKMSKKEFETWEDLVGDELKRADKEAQRANFGLEGVAESEQYMVLSDHDEELSETIEVQAGRFYHQRIDALKKAIKEGGGNKDDLDFVDKFYPMVASHLEFKYMSTMNKKNSDQEIYNRKRTASHNAVIRHLNGMNDLMRLYQVRPLTVRNFWPSDIRREEDQTPAVARIMKYDRKIVEAYYETAFSTEVDRIESRWKRDFELGIY